MHFFSVCDGHGVLGHHVSDFVKQHLPAFLALDSNLLTNPKLALFNAVGMTNHKLALSDIDCMFSGTTMVSFLIQKKKLYTANSGDSRAIIGRKRLN
jgi:serine/threonine protein phosphatase PrpC